MHFSPALVFFALASSVVDHVLVKGMRVPARGAGMEDGSRVARGLLVGGHSVGIVVDGGTAPGFVVASAGAVPESSSVTHGTASVEFDGDKIVTSYIDSEGVAPTDRADIQQNVDEHCILRDGDSDLPSVLASTGCPVGTPLLDRAFPQNTATSVTYVLSRREDLGGNKSWVYRNMPWIVVLGALLLAFSTAAMFIFFRGRKYQSLQASAPEGLEVAVSLSPESVFALKSLELAHAPPPPRHSLHDPMMRTNQWQVTKPKGDGADLLGKRRRSSQPLAGRMSLGEDSVLLQDNDAPPRLWSPPVAVFLPSDKPPVPSTLSAPVAASESRRVAPLAPTVSSSSRPSAPSAIAVASNTADPVRSRLADVPSTPQPRTPTYNPLHKHWGHSADETMMFTLDDVDEESLPNPYDDDADSPSAQTGTPVHSSSPTPPAGAPVGTGHMPNPSRSFAIRPLPIPPVREIRPQPSPSSTLDTTTNSRSSTVYTLPPFELSSTSLSINLSSSPTPSLI